MVNLIPLVDILEHKKGKTKEAHLVFFEQCNLRCSFCHQDHESTVGVSGAEIHSKVKLLCEVTDPSDPIVVNLTGGELFSDDIPDSMFKHYLNAGLLLLKHFPEVKLVWGTNLVYSSLARVVNLITTLRSVATESQNVCLATSHDPAGRFTEANRRIFLFNLKLLKDYVETVNVVITRQNIQLFLDDREGDEFQWLCRDYDVYFDHYIPSDRYQEHQPTEVQISELYIKLNVKYPNSYPIKGWKENQFNETTCRSTKIITKDGVVTTCWSEAGQGAVLDEVEGLNAKHEAEEQFLEHYECHACEYFQRCGLRCFLHHTLVDTSSRECEIKKMFDVVL